ncbi:MAG: DUF2752 domain-containing protein [Deltaproteobacteria bacterium]|nr:DUF2752 domain-containing protein [Deltaproteobacteria bacterium]
MTKKKFEIVALLFLFSLFLFSFVAPLNSLDSVPLCIFKTLTHFDCPGCGLSRSFLSLSHGHFLGAIRHNALGPVVYLLFLLYFFKALFAFFSSSWIQYLQKPLFQNPFSYYSFAFLFWGQWIFKLCKAFLV